MRFKFMQFDFIDFCEPEKVTIRAIHLIENIFPDFSQSAFHHLHPQTHSSLIMEAASASAEALKQQIKDTENELAALKAQLAQVENPSSSPFHDGTAPRTWPLSNEEYTRYGRQMIVPNVGIQGR